MSIYRLQLARSSSSFNKMFKDPQVLKKVYPTCFRKICHKGIGGQVNAKR